MFEPGGKDIHVQLVAAIPNELTAEYYRGPADPMWGQMFVETSQFEDGNVRPSDRPGFGISPIEKALAPHQVAQQYSPGIRNRSRASGRNRPCSCAIATGHYLPHPHPVVQGRCGRRHDETGKGS